MCWAQVLGLKNVMASWAFCQEMHGPRPVPKGFLCCSASLVPAEEAKASLQMPPWQGGSSSHIPWKWGQELAFAGAEIECWDSQKPHGTRPLKLKRLLSFLTHWITGPIWAAGAVFLEKQVIVKSWHGHSILALGVSKRISPFQAQGSSGRKDLLLVMEQEERHTTEL